MVDDPAGGRLRVWRVAGPGAERFAAPEVIERVEFDEFLWLAADSDLGASWMADDSPVTLLELFDQVPSVAATWIVDRTFALLAPILGRVLALEVDEDGEPLAGAAQALSEELEHDPEVERLGTLLDEFNRLGVAATAFGERIGQLAGPDGSLGAAEFLRPQAAA